MHSGEAQIARMSSGELVSRFKGKSLGAIKFHQREKYARAEMLSEFKDVPPCMMNKYQAVGFDVDNIVFRQKGENFRKLIIDFYMQDLKDNFFDDYPA